MRHTALGLAAAEAIARDEDSTVDTALVAHGWGLAAANQRILEEDREGRLWPAGLVGRCLAQARVDARYSFSLRFSRSMYFGELIATVIERDIAAVSPVAEVATVGRLINLFITAFDGICDEVPELLPAVLPPLRELFADFPSGDGSEPVVADPVVRLTCAVASTATRTLRPALLTSPRVFRDQFTECVQEAFRAQLGSVARASASNGDTTARQAQQGDVSRAAFRVAVLIPAVYHAETRSRVGDLLLAGNALGDYFGWIDDLVDLEEDAAGGRPNMVGDWVSRRGGLSSGPRHTSAATEIADEARTRWRLTIDALRDLGLGSAAMERHLAAASLAWLGGFRVSEAATVSTGGGRYGDT